MKYTVGKMAKRLGIAPSTLRYYDSEGLLPFLERTDGGVRTFRESDYEWLGIIICLKRTGMQLKDIKAFIEMAMQGDETIEPRLELIVKQRKAVEVQISELEETLRTLEFKEWYYKKAKECGSTAVPRSMPTEELPEEFRSVRSKLKGI